MQRRTLLPDALDAGNSRFPAANTGRTEISMTPLTGNMRMNIHLYTGSGVVTLVVTPGRHRPICDPQLESCRRNSTSLQRRAGPTTRCLKDPSAHDQAALSDCFLDDEG